MSINRRAFYFLRHAQTDANLNQVLAGHTDVRINDNGHAQGLRMAAYVPKIKATEIFHSPLTRVLETMAYVETHLSLPKTEVADLMECSFGEYEGKSIADNRDDFFKNWLNGDTFKGGESYVQFKARVLESFNQVLSQSIGVPLVIGHGGYFMTLTELMGFTPPLRSENTEIYHCQPHETSATDWHVTSLNEMEFTENE